MREDVGQWPVATEDATMEEEMVKQECEEQCARGKCPFTITSRGAPGYGSSGSHPSTVFLCRHATGGRG